MAWEQQINSQFDKSKANFTSKRLLEWSRRFSWQTFGYDVLSTLTKFKTNGASKHDQLKTKNNYMVLYNRLSIHVAKLSQVQY